MIVEKNVAMTERFFDNHYESSRINCKNSSQEGLTT